VYLPVTQSSYDIFLKLNREKILRFKPVPLFHVIRKVSLTINTLAVMKTKLFFSSIVFLALFACRVVDVADAQVHVSLYTKIPMAPNVVLRVETPVIATPGPDYIWVDGYWTWDSRYREYVWIQGYWALAPYSGAYWIPGYWEHYRNGYRWVEACWLPRDYHLHFGYYSGRYDYYGRPVYYHQPPRESRVAYSYSYDHRPEYIGKGYSSSQRFNEAPRSERSRINKEYQKESQNSVRSVPTNQRRQESIRISDNETQTQRRSESVSPTREQKTETPKREVTKDSNQSRETTRQPATNTRSENSSTNSRQQNTEKSNSSSTSRESQVKTNNSNSRSSSGSSSSGRKRN
jgi:hypothetical protein